MERKQPINIVYVPHTVGSSTIPPSYALSAEEAKKLALDYILKNFIIKTG